MKQYVIDGLRPEDHKKLEEYLDRNLEASPLGGLYWLRLDREILGPVQKSHEECAPHLFALELGDTYLSCELLVRIKNNIKCDCMGYATSEQRDWLIETVDSILMELNIDL